MVVIVMGLFPPWTEGCSTTDLGGSGIFVTTDKPFGFDSSFGRQRIKTTNHSSDKGYHLVFAPPPSWLGHSSINVPRLVIQWVVVSAVTAVVFILSGRSERAGIKAIVIGAVNAVDSHLTTRSKLSPPSDSDEPHTS